MEPEGLIRFVLALVFVLGLIGLLASLARRFGLGYRTPRAKGSPRRLSLVEVVPLDGRRRLVLVRRDAREHLILLGGSTAGDLVIERDIPVALPSVGEAGVQP